MDPSTSRPPRPSLRAPRERKITAEDLYQLKEWRESEPEAPEGLWYKDFGSFKICGEGHYPKTFLLRGQAAKGEKL
jgi:hypothetical protein